MPQRRVLLVASNTGYQTRMFGDAAARLGASLLLATDHCRTVHPHEAIAVRFDRIARSAATVRIDPPPDAILAVGDRPAELAAHLAARFGLPFHSPEAAHAARNKRLTRERFAAAGLPTPRWHMAGERAPRFPCVLKPLGLSASRGVIRAETPEDFERALRRIHALLDRAEIRHFKDAADRDVLVEDYIPGREFAIEGVVRGGRFHALAVFDKPDPLDGPYFEETLYITPSRAPRAVQDSLVDTAARAAAALGLSDGPVHAELRHDGATAWPLEAAARPIGGLCARALRFAGERSLEELLLAHALGEDVAGARLSTAAAGVMMIPIARRGIYQSAAGEDEARAVPLIEDVIVTAQPGQLFEPLPEGKSYLGFIFARGDSAAAVEAALRAAHARLRFEFQATLDVLPAAP